jgi:hypothetical protein
MVGSGSRMSRGRFPAVRIAELQRRDADQVVFGRWTHEGTRWDGEHVLTATNEVDFDQIHACGEMIQLLLAVVAGALIDFVART